MNIIINLHYIPRFRPVTVTLLMVALGIGCSHVRTPQNAVHTIGAEITAAPTDHATPGKPIATAAVAPTPQGVLSGADLATVRPIDASPRGTSSALPAATGSEMSEFPIVLNDRVKAALKHLQTHRSDDIAKAFWRARRYAGMMRSIFREYDLPEELVNLAFVESDVNPRATSHAQAAGIWQFVPSTAHTYGMRTTASLDERRDPEKSTRAAAEHLKSLYKRFQAWPLTLAAYNAGENAIQRAIKRQRTRDFWQLRLPRETRWFVPKFMAMTIIARDPRRYGFSPPPEAPHDTEILHVNQSTDIRQIAEAAGTTVTHLRELNPELVGKATPPDQPRYALRIPRRFTWISHTVKKGETLSAIAHRYKASLQVLREVNRLDPSHEPAAGRIILVPAKASPPPA